MLIHRRIELKKVIAALGTIVFLLILLIKPFDFAEVYSVHAGKMVKSISTNTTSEDVSAANMAEREATTDRQVMIGISNAAQEVSAFKTAAWMVSLLLIAAITVAAAARRKRINHPIDDL
mgnify:CR=1 FL=1|jgi:hypothetical protein